MNFCDILPKENSNTGFTYVYVAFDCSFGTWQKISSTFLQCKYNSM